MRRDILYLILLMFIMDIAIFMDIPILRQSLPFIFFSTIPGYLLVKIMNLDLKLLEKSLLSVGLSLAMLIFTGLVINTAYPIIKRPVSLLPMVISLNLLTAILLIVYYLRHVPGGKAVLNIKDAISAPTVFSFLFPVLTAIGSYLMNTYLVNTVLLGVLLTIPLYIIVLTVLRDRLDNSTYPAALFNIGLSLLIMNGLPSSYLIGRDIHAEYFLFRSVLINGHWSTFGAINNAYNACLSVTILPAIYKLILNVPAVYIFKFYNIKEIVCFYCSYKIIPIN